VAIWSRQVDSKHQYVHPKVSFILKIGKGTNKNDYLDRQRGLTLLGLRI
jgi:hypothetical protein